MKKEAAKAVQGRQIAEERAKLDAIQRQAERTAAYLWASTAEANERSASSNLRATHSNAQAALLQQDVYQFNKEETRVHSAHMRDQNAAAASRAHELQMLQLTQQPALSRLQYGGPCGHYDEQFALTRPALLRLKGDCGPVQHIFQHQQLQQQVFFLLCLHMEEKI